MAWLVGNWKRIVLVAGTAVGALTADHTLAHKISEFLVGWLPTVPF